MDTSRFTAPLTDHLPTHLPTTSASAVMSHLTDTTSELAGQIGDQAGHLADQVGDIDVAGTIRRGRRLVARAVPGVSASRTRFTTRHWVVAAVAVAAVVAAFVALRRRSNTEAEAAPRDDWATPSSNGVSAGPTSAERDDATAGATTGV